MSLTVISFLGMLVAVILASRGQTIGRSAIILLIGLGVWLLLNGSHVF